MCTWGWHITHCLQPVFIKARCTVSWECKAARPPAYPLQQLPAFSPAAACSWNCTMQRHDAFSHARAGLLLTTSFSLLSWEHDQLYGIFLELPFFLLPCLLHSFFELQQGCAEVSEEFSLASVPFSDGFGLVLLWPEDVQQSIQQPSHPQRSARSPAAQLLEQYWESRQQWWAWPCIMYVARTPENSPARLHSGSPIPGSMRIVKVRE